MAINESRLDELEARINGFETILKDIRDELKSRNMDVNTKTVVTTNESFLTDVERAKIQNIMDNFDFNKVHDIMERLDWKWAMTKWGVPTVDELKNEAHRILVDACYENTYISTGGFRAVYEVGPAPDDQEPYIGLEFIVEECEGFVDDDDDDDNSYDAKDDED